MVKNDRKVTSRNYFVVGIMIVVIFALTLIIHGWYNSYKEEELNTSVLTGKIQEITSTDFENFSTAHSWFLLYIGSPTDNNSRMIEKDLIKTLEDKNKKEDTIYLNISNIEDKHEYLNNSIKNYLDIDKEVNYPFFGIVHDNKIVDYVMKENGKSLTISKIIELLDSYGVGN